MARILFISATLSFGGAEKMLIFTAEQMANKGHMVHIANLMSTNSVSDYQRQVHPLVKVHQMNETGNLSKLSMLKSLISLARDIRAEVVIGFTQFPNMYASIIGKVLRIPSIMSERGDPQRTGLGTGMKGKLILSIINRCSGGVFQTEGARSVYSRRLVKRSTVIPNPIFITGEIPFVPYSEREKSVVSVGRLDNLQKRYDVMLKAFQLFSEKHPEYVLKLYGRGNDEQQIAKWAEELGIADKVQMMGLTTQPMQDIAGDGMFLITSDYEGISNSLLEAMAVGLPCVSTDHTPGGARMLIQDHENGLLAPVEDAPRLAAAMSEFADDLQLAAKCGESAKDVINRFAPARIIDMWESYILKLCR